MDCPVCLLQWDLQDVRPKALPCLHTLCQSCLGRLNDRQCPTCRQEPRAVQQEAPPAAQQPAEGRIEELNLLRLSTGCADARGDEKAETLRLVRHHGVRRMTYVCCHVDPTWSLDVLRSATPTLEELQVFKLREEHLVVLHAMPRLRRLSLLCDDSDLHVQPPSMPTLPQVSSLQWLRVRGLPRATTQSLLQAHGASLEVLWLGVRAEPGGDWPEGCTDLDAFLGQCGLSLSRLVLFRSGLHCFAEVCRAQVAAARRVVLPGCTVQCGECDDVNENF